jgi:hypothetical protein
VISHEVWATVFRGEAASFVAIPIVGVVTAAEASDLTSPSWHNAANTINNNANPLIRTIANRPAMFRCRTVKRRIALPLQKPNSIFIKTPHRSHHPAMMENKTQSLRKYHKNAAIVSSPSAEYTSELFRVW